MSLRRVLHRSRLELSDAQRLDLEAHLQQCPACASDVDLIENLRGVIGLIPSRPLAPHRIERAMDRAFSVAAQSADPRGAPRRHRAWLLVTAASLAVCAAGLLMWKSGATESAPSVPVASVSRAVDRLVSGDVLIQGQSLVANEPIPSQAPLLSRAGALMVLDRAQVEMSPRTEARWDSQRDTLYLDAGSLEVAVASSPRKFSVTTRVFRVVVAGARFRITPESVTVVEGVLFVHEMGSDVSGVEVRAGNSWAVSSRPASQVDEDVSATDSVRAAEDPPVPARDREATPSAEEWLEHARRALATGAVDEARRAAHSALGILPTRQQAAEARTLLAQCALAAGDPTKAAVLYLDVARRYRSLRAGQTALFAVARLEANRGNNGEACRLFRRYLKTYPGGTFAEDARRRLRALGEGETTDAPRR